MNARSDIRTFIYGLLPVVMLCSAVFFYGCGGDKEEVKKPLPIENPDDDDDDQEPEPANVTLKLADQTATAETKALYSNLWKVAETGFMFGHHDDLWYGRKWYNVPGKSDTKDVCGDYPAVFSVDFASIMDSRATAADQSENAIRRRVILEAYERGEVITACCHLNNPITERSNGNWDAYPAGTSWDNSKAVDKVITAGTDANAKFLKWLDRLADFALNLKGSDGKPVPVIFRPFHEHTQSWSWWGTSACSESEFIALWRLTVDYLKSKGVHNFIYAISPQMDETYSNARSRLISRWPGDNYVDFLGMDCYHGLNTTAFGNNLTAIDALSQELKKPCGVTETGAEAFTKSDYWTSCILTPMYGKKVSMVVMWRNKYVGNNDSDTHYFSVFPGHSSVNDFIQMYNNSRSIFSADLPDMYKMADGVTVQ